MKRILIVASSCFFIRCFLLPHIEWLSQNGWIVDIASDSDNGDAIPNINKHIILPIKRTPIHIDNLRSIEILQQYIDRTHYDIINCHTPIGAMVARMAARKYRTNGTKVIYMTHGLHFYHGAPIKNRVFYFLAEKFMAQYTDALITINSEDRYNVQHHFKNIAHQYYIPGIGYDTNHIDRPSATDKNTLREHYGVQPDDFVCLYVARFTRDKNHRFLIASLPEILHHIPSCKLLFVGDGEELDNCRKLVATMQLERSIIFTGYQNNISDYLRLSDVGISASKSEGLGLGLIEEMHTTLPILASRVRGHIDIIEEGVNGLLYTLNDRADFIKKLLCIYQQPQEAALMASRAKNNLSKYEVNNIKNKLLKIFEHELS